MEAIEQRVERLERSARRYRLVTIGLALVITAGVTIGQTRSDIVDVVKTRRLEVYNNGSSSEG